MQRGAGTSSWSARSHHGQAATPASVTRYRDESNRCSQHDRLGRIRLWRRTYTPHVHPTSHMAVHWVVSEAAKAQSLDRQWPCSCRPRRLAPPLGLGAALGLITDLVFVRFRLSDPWRAGLIPNRLAVRQRRPCYPKRRFEKTSPEYAMGATI